MTVRQVWVGGQRLTVRRDWLPAPGGEYRHGEKRVAVSGNLKLLLTIAALCN